ncbi:Mechanosensitive ion channel [Chitinophaga jiangningensis]|uniref:Mechanosensitive ion channel n=1 Tax=Chitinophaga jiangningensis TaxID=1419482 RepID=A0A1M7EIQ2_9BACT|nr:mechanosensitive ion channel family protein [Chitinophaga jiangningensis]SHL91583.1 Mechanosensitive ion channel [Chitinophaga jiangningensis]
MRLLCSIICCCLLISGFAQSDTTTHLKSGVPVKPFGDTLFFIYNQIGPLVPTERAAQIERKIKRLTENPLFSPDSLLISPNEANLDVSYGDEILFSVTAKDSAVLHLSKDSIARYNAGRIGSAVSNYQQEFGWKAILHRFLWLAVVLIAFTGLVILINFIFRRIKMRLVKRKDSLFKGLHVSGYALMNPSRQLAFAFMVLRIIRIAVILLVLYLTLPIIFSIFPWTEGLADTLLHWTLDPLKAILKQTLAYLPKLLTILVIYLITRGLVRLVGFLSKEVANGNLVIKGFYADWARPTASGIKFLLYAFMFVIIFPYLPGSDSKVFQGVSVFLGILFSLGSSSAISNIIAGFVITYMRPFRIGDRIRLGEITGDVIEKSLLVTRLRTIKNEEITVPNASILNGHTINYSTSSKELGLILHTTVTIGYEVPWNVVHDLLIKAAMETDGLLKDKTPFVLQTALNDFAVAYEINAYTDQPNKMAVIYSELHRQIHIAFNNAGVEVMSPHYYAHRDGNHSTVSAEQLPKDYQAPPFHVNISAKD